MSEDVRKRIGTMLRALREERGFSLGQVQHLTHDIDWPISRSRLSQLERGEVEVHLSDLYPLSRTYGFSIGSLISEAIIAHSKKKFAKGLSAEELFEQAKELFRIGKPLEAAWAFDEAARRADDGNADFRHLCLISAGHCYERLDAYNLALNRVEAVIDSADESSADYLRALAKAGKLLAQLGATGRAEIFASKLEEILRQRQKPDLRAFAEGTLAVTRSLLGDPARAVALARSASRHYSKLGNFSLAAKTRAGAAEFELSKPRPRLKIAISLSRDALGYLDDDAPTETRAYVLLVRGEALYRAARFEEAIPSLTEATEISTGIGARNLVEKALPLLCRCCEEIGDRKAASKWNKRRERLPPRPKRELSLRPRDRGDREVIR